MTKMFEVKKTRRIVWTNEEDTQLLTLVRSGYRGKWKYISTHFPGKSNFDCYIRFGKINPSYKKGKWSEEEDERILNLINEHGYNWAKLSQIIINRSSRQIRSRYINYLDKTLIKTQFTKEEDDLVKRLFPVLKNNWARYINYLPNRSPKIIQNRYRVLKDYKGQF